MDIEKTREWVNIHKRIKDEEKLLIFPALDAMEELSNAENITREQLEPIITAARCRWLSVWDIGSSALVELACTHRVAQDIMRELAKSKKSNERYAVIVNVSTKLPKEFLYELLRLGLQDRGQAVRRRAAERCDSLRITELLPDLEQAYAIEKNDELKNGFMGLGFHLGMLRDGYYVTEDEGEPSLWVRGSNGWGLEDITQQQIDEGRILEAVARNLAREPEWMKSSNVNEG